MKTFIRARFIPHRIWYRAKKFSPYVIALALIIPTSFCINRMLVWFGGHAMPYCFLANFCYAITSFVLACGLVSIIILILFVVVALSYYVLALKLKKR
jgi:hypothetical protein